MMVANSNFLQIVDEGMNMAYFLAKTDPATYSIEQLEHDQRTTWDGVRNAQAIRAIQSMRPGDTIFIYHSAGAAAIVSLVRAISEPRPDVQDAKSWVIDVEFVASFAQPVTLHEIKASHLFDDWSLVRQSRLSTMSVPEQFIHWLKDKQVI